MDESKRMLLKTLVGEENCDLSPWENTLQLPTACYWNVKSETLEFPGHSAGRKFSDVPLLVTFAE